MVQVTGWWAASDFDVFGDVRECLACGRPTRFVELNFQAPLHPQCGERAWNDYRRAMIEPLPSLWFDRSGNPIDLHEWSDLHMDRSNIIVQRTYLHGCLVSTVWLGVDHGFGTGPLLIFETMVFNRRRRKHGRPWSPDQWQCRYSTEAQARLGHERVANRIRSRGWASLERWR